jgi:predicted metal-dependent TIM-barrel fold hydrolase
MPFIDPHIHCASRVTDDYERMAIAGCMAVSEPAFWAGFDRGTPMAFRDYFRQLVEVEPKRAARYGIKHYTWLCINPKEAEDVAFSREVIALIPEFLEDPSVLGVGEIGLNKITHNEIIIFREQVALAQRHQKLIMVHTPHLEDKWKGTRIILEVLREMQVDPGRVLIDHVEEHTAPLALDQGYWVGITLYPSSKCSIPRAIDIVERFGPSRILMNSGGDWGPSDPLAVPKLQVQMRLRGQSMVNIQAVTYTNSLRFFALSGKIEAPESFGLAAHS